MKMFLLTLINPYLSLMAQSEPLITELTEQDCLSIHLSQTATTLLQFQYGDRIRIIIFVLQQDYLRAAPHNQAHFAVLIFTVGAVLLFVYITIQNKPPLNNDMPPKSQIFALTFRGRFTIRLISEVYLFDFSMIFSAHLMPSTAAEIIPPA